VSTWSAIRLAAGIAVTLVGSLLLVASLPAAIAAGAIQSSVGRSGVVAEPLGTLRAADGDRAVLVDEVNARLVIPPLHPWLEQGLAAVSTSPDALSEDLGTLVLIALPETDVDTFIGVSGVDSVNDYLVGTPYSVAVREGNEWPTISVPGDARPVAPNDVDIWTASASGLAPELPAEALDGTTLVLMRTDAEPGAGAALRLEYRVPGADIALQAAAVSAAGAALGGLLLILLGAWLVVGRRPGHESPS
jgi:hypothetical protein